MSQRDPIPNPLRSCNLSRPLSTEQPPVRASTPLSFGPQAPSLSLGTALTRSFFSGVRSIIASHPPHPRCDVAKWNVEFYLLPLGSVHVINDWTDITPASVSMLSRKGRRGLTTPQLLNVQ